MVDKIEAKEATISVTLVPLDLVDDNPFNSRQAYSEDEIKNMAESIKQNGLLEAPEGRNGKDGRVQVAFGHKRLRAYRSLATSNSAEKWKRFPVFIVELTDTQMLDKAIEENLQRSDVKPIEVARALAAFEKAHPEIKDKDIAKKHGMSEGQISNMKRVLKLPQKFLDMIDEGQLSFTQGRELLTLDGTPDAEDLMTKAVNGLVDLPDTVEGLKKSIQNVKPGAQPAIEKREQREKAAESVAELKEAAAAKFQETTEAGIAGKNISQEKSVKEAADTKPAKNVTKPIESVTKEPEPVTKAGQGETKLSAPALRTMLLEETEKGVNISFSAAKGGMVIRGVLGNLDTVFAELPAILKEMTAETKGGKK